MRLNGAYSTLSTQVSATGAVGRNSSSLSTWVCLKLASAILGNIASVSAQELWRSWVGCLFDAEPPTTHVWLWWSRTNQQVSSWRHDACEFGHQHRRIPRLRATPSGNGASNGPTPDPCTWASAEDLVPERNLHPPVPMLVCLFGRRHRASGSSSIAANLALNAANSEPTSERS